MKFRVVLLLTVCLLIYCQIRLRPVLAQGYTPDQQRVIAAIYKYATLYGVSASDMLGVAYCESGWNPNAVGDNGRSLGFAQWYDYGLWWSTTPGQLGYSRFDIEAGAWGMAEAFSRGQQGHWSCWRYPARWAWAPAPQSGGGFAVSPPWTPTSTPSRALPVLPRHKLVQLGLED